MTPDHSLDTTATLGRKAKTTHRGQADNLLPYDQYELVDLGWETRLPATWTALRLKHLVTLMKRPVQEDDEIVTCFRDGTVTLRSNRRTDGFTNADKEIGYQGVRKGDLVIHAMDAFAGAIGVSDSDGKSTPVYSVCAPLRGKANAHYLSYALREMARRGYITSLGQGIRERSTDFRWSNASEVMMPVPPFEEQCRIAAFLDHETARIDELVHEQQRLIGLLREKRQALVRTAMTKGLNPSAPMKDSGEGGIGIVPCHWKVAQLKYFFDSLDFMRVPLKSEDRGKRPGKYPYYGASGIIDFIDDYIFSEDLVLVSEDGANLLLRSTPIAFVARGQYWVNNHAHILRPRDGLVEYWAELIEQMDITVGVTGSAQPKLTSEALGALIIATPPDSAERRAIASHIATASADLDSLIRESSFVIDLLVERRSALISAAVTGQLDLRNWQPSEQEAVAEVA